MTTVAELIQQVGEDLALVAIGQGLDNQDKVRIEDTYRFVYNRLKQLGIVTWAFSGSIPEEAVPYIAILVEEKLLVAYSVPDERYLRIKAEAGPDGKEAVKNLAVVVSATSDDYAEATDY